MAFWTDATGIGPGLQRKARFLIFPLGLVCSYQSTVGLASKGIPYKKPYIPAAGDMWLLHAYNNVGLCAVYLTMLFAKLQHQLRTDVLC